MFIVREVRNEDIPALLHLIQELDEAGLAAPLQADRASIESLTTEAHLFALEDIHQKLILGISFLRATDLAAKLAPPIVHPDYQNLPLHLEKHLSASRLIYAALHPDRFKNDFSNKGIKKVRVSSERLRTTGDLALLASQGSQGFVCFYIHYRHDDQGILITEEALQMMKNFGARLDHLYFLESI